MSPLVSIIIPCFNGAKHIECSINSCINQTYANLEIIVVDDGSIDSSKKVIHSIIDKRIKYFYQENSGSPVAKNYGLKEAKGRYIQFLDCDDHLSSNKISSQVGILENSNNSIAVCRTKIFSNDEDLTKDNLPEIDTHYLTYSEVPREFLLNLMGINGRIGMVQPNAFLIPRKVIDKSGFWSETLNRSPDDDSEFMCRVLLNSERIIYDSDSISFYRKSINELSSSKKEINAFGALHTIDLKRQYILSIEDSSEIRYMLAKHYTNFIYSYGVYYPHLMFKALERIEMLQVSKIPPIGGTKFTVLRNIIGFKNSIRLIFLINCLNNLTKT